jgi:recombination protein RecA
MAAKKAAKEESAPKAKGTGDSVLDAVRGKHGAESMVRLGAHQFQHVEKTPSGSLALDMALGGGYPRGRIIEVFGVESSGKTTLALHAIAEVQRLGEQAAFIDAEHALDPEYAKALGVDIAQLLFAQPQSGEEALDVAESLASTGEVSLIVIDSVAALTPLAEIEGDMAQQHVGVQARMMSKALRKLCSVLNRKRCTAIFINQLRMKIGVMYGNPEVTPGGNALKYYASQRLDVRRREHVKEGDDAIGNKVEVKVVKNKVAPPFQAAGLTIRWGVGVDRPADLLDAAVASGVVDKAGSWYSFGDVKLAQGTNSAAAKLGMDPELWAAVNAATREKLGLV